MSLSTTPDPAMPYRDRKRSAWALSLLVPALERWLAKIVLAPTFHGHFAIEHDRGHHRDVATPADPASARMGESIWRFVLREMPGSFVRAWHPTATSACSPSRTSRRSGSP